MACRSITPTHRRPLAPSHALLLAAVLSLCACREAPRTPPVGPSPVALVQAEQARAAGTLAVLERQHLTWPEDRALFADAARGAWNFIDRNFQPATGFVNPLGGYPYATMWDIGGMLAAIYSAHGLGLIDDATYAAKVNSILATLARLQLTEEHLFNKAYDTRTGAMARVGHGPTVDSGWSAIDLGRLLTWLKIIGGDPAFTQKVEAIVRRNDLSTVLSAGYLMGAGRDQHGRKETYQEGELGYEQYAARGLALWGYRAEKALHLAENGLPIHVMGQPLMADYRRWDRLTNEPFLLWGLETGWDPRTAIFVRRMLRAQEERARRTGFVTITGEDAMSEPPHYFYYYCIFSNGLDFAIDVQDRTAVVDGPRWISTKSAFAFHALMPTSYTDSAMEALGAAGGPSGWSSGVYETTGKPTGNISINTAAVILEAALVALKGGPILQEGVR